MEGKGQLSGAALSWGLEGCVARKWHCANVGGPLPLNYKQILPGTLCSGPALPPHRLLEMRILLPTATFSQGRPSEGEKREKTAKWKHCF